MYEQLGDKYIESENKDEEAKDAVSSDEDEAAAEAWEPIPKSKDSLNFYVSAKTRHMDTISTLVNIYGSPDQFIKVYQQMLDQRLLSSLNVSYESELRNLELMKLRFGEKSLH